MIIAVCSILVFVLLLFTALIVVNRIMVSRADDRITDTEDIDSIDKPYSAIVVLGAGLKADGSPSHMLEDRLKGAVALYKKGVSDTVILSGDNSGEKYDEVTAMETYCLEAGIPEEAIIRDDIGFSTYETVYNTVKSGKYEKVIFVTQKYHLYRAIYLAEKMGAEADGFSADYRLYRGQIFRDLREYMARAKDFLKVNFGLH